MNGAWGKSLISYVILPSIAFVLLACAGFAIPADLLLNALFGWIVFLWGVLPKVHVNGSGVATGVACLILLAAGTHLFFGWLCPAMSGRRWEWRWTGSLVAGIVLMFVAGLATAGMAHQVGWLVASDGPWFSSGRDNHGPYGQSQHNLKNIVLAVDAYALRRGEFPRVAFDQIGRPLHSWITMTLPDLEATQYYSSINFQIPWDNPVNEWVFRKPLSICRNPGVRGDTNLDDRGYALTQYAGNVHVLGGDRVWKPGDIKDGTGQTILIGEAAGNFRAWGDPVNWRDPALGINKSPDGFGSPFPGGANFAFVDGSVRFVKETIDPKILKALGTPDGGEKISEDDY